MTTFREGDRCRDGNRNWPRYGQTGTVVSMGDGHVTWKSNTDGKFITDPRKDMILSRW